MMYNLLVFGHLYHQPKVNSLLHTSNMKLQIIKFYVYNRIPMNSLLNLPRLTVV